MRNFYLMNKDTHILQFTIKEVMGTTSIDIVKGFTNIISLSFKGILSFNRWVEDRLILSHRADIFSLLKKQRVF